MPESGPVAILAGSGDLPGLIADCLEREGREARILALRGFAERSLRRRAHAVLDILDVKGASAKLAEWKPSAVTFAGGVRRPKPSVALNAYSVVRNLSEIREAMARGDDKLLRGIIGLIEDAGHKVVGVHELAPELLAQAGVQGAVTPSDADWHSIRHGFHLLDTLSPYDIGQAGVLAVERVLAIEGPEGTDRMLARVRSLNRGILPWSKAEPGILVKAPKRGQDLRVDLPAIGPRTIENAAKAGLKGVAIASRATLVLDQARTVALADKLGLFLVGVERDREGIA